MRRARPSANARARARPPVACLAGLAAILLFAAPAAAIVGGAPAARGRYPFFAEVLARGQPVCGGTLVAADRVLTAAHCLAERPDAVLVGAGRERRLVAHAAQHPLFVREARRSERELGPPPPPDLMLLGLDRPVAGVVPLAIASATPSPGTALRFAGTGVTSAARDDAGPLRDTPALLLAADRCRRELRRAGSLAPAWLLCTGDPDGRRPFRAPCFGDSGGPLLATGSSGAPEVVAVDSWSSGCGEDARPEMWASAVAGRAFVTDGAPVWAPRAAGPPSLAGRARPGDTLTCRAPRWIDPPAGVSASFSLVRGPVRQIGPRTTYRVRAADAGRRLTCALEARSAGGTTRTASAPGRRVAG